MKKELSRIKPVKDKVLHLIMEKYNSDPNGFRNYLPDVAEILDSVFPIKPKYNSPFGLTALEIKNRIDRLNDILLEMQNGKLERQDAIKALENCAVLTKDDSLPIGISRNVIIRFLGVVLGKPLSDITSESTIDIMQNDSYKIANRVPILRGIVFNLTSEEDLISISITPRKFKERTKALRFVAKDEHSRGSISNKNILTEDPNATS